MTTISNSTTHAISLTYPTYQNPLVILAGVTISYSGGSPAISSSTNSSSWTIQNGGQISGYYGIRLNSGGSIDNLATAAIFGYGHGVSVSYGPGTVDNDGIISGTASITGYGIRLTAGGSITNSTDGSITGGFVGVHISGAAGTVANSGSITSTNTVFGYGIRLAAGGSVTNSSAGSIVGNNGGISVSERYNGHPGAAAKGAVLNYGSIVGISDVVFGQSYGVNMYAGGSVTNAASAVIVGGSYGIKMEYPGPNLSNPFRGTVINDGTIVAESSFDGSGVVLGYDGLVMNALKDSVIQGYSGVNLQAGTTTVFNEGTIIGTGTYAGRPAILLTGTQNTLRNAGTITGKSGTAVVFSNTGSNLLVLDPGAFIDGVVVGGRSATNTIELASAASAGTLTGLTAQFTNFGSISIDAGSQWSIVGNTSELTGTISGFAYGDTIQVTGVTATGSYYAGGILTLTEASGQVTLNLPGNFTTSDFLVENTGVAADVMVTAPCFGSGTRIRTARGEVRVDDLRQGDTVTAHFGNERTVSALITWIGIRAVNCRRHPSPKLVWPVVIRKGTFGVDLPSRDLFLSPDHAIYFDGVLIPVKYLINGTTIVQTPRSTVTYYHIELTRHGVVFAEGLSVESYLDTGDRSKFSNGGEPVVLHPDFASRKWEAEGCAPLIVTGPKLSAAQHRASANINIRCGSLLRRR